MLVQSVSERFHPVGRTCAGAVHELGASSGEDSHRSFRGLSPVEGTPHWSRGRVKSCPIEKEAVTKMCYGLTTATTSHSPMSLGGKR